MNSKRLWPRIIGLTLLLMLLAACGTPQPTSTPTPIPPTATPTPIPPISTPTPVPPTATLTPVPPTATPALPTASPTPTRPSYSQSKLLNIPSISAIVGEGTARFASGEEPGELRVEIDGTIPIVEGEWCLCCVNTIHIAPDLRIPTTPFFVDTEAPAAPAGLVSESMQMAGMVLSSRIPDDATEFIVSGPEGATLRKEGNGFLVVEGEAHLLQTTGEPAQAQPSEAPALAAADTPTPVPPTTAPTKLPPTRTPKPPAPTAVPLLPTPGDWAAADWTEIARVVLRSAKVYRPQMVEVQALLRQTPTNCPRLAQLLDSLANAPQYKEVQDILWEHRDRGGVEGQLYSFKDAYADGVNQFRLDVFRAVSQGCAAGTQPTAEQRQMALAWMEQTTDPIGKMDFVITNLDPVVGL